MSERIRNPELKVAIKCVHEYNALRVRTQTGVFRSIISFIKVGQFCPTAKPALILCAALDKKFEKLFSS